MPRLLTSVNLGYEENCRAIGRGEYRKMLAEDPELREAIERDEDAVYRARLEHERKQREQKSEPDWDDIRESREEIRREREEK